MFRLGKHFGRHKGTLIDSSKHRILWLQCRHQLDENLRGWLKEHGDEQTVCPQCNLQSPSGLSTIFVVDGKQQQAAAASIWYDGGELRWKYNNDADRTVPDRQLVECMEKSIRRSVMFASGLPISELKVANLRVVPIQDMPPTDYDQSEEILSTDGNEQTTGYLLLSIELTVTLTASIIDRNRPLVLHLPARRSEAADNDSTVREADPNDRFDKDDNLWAEFRRLNDGRPLSMTFRTQMQLTDQPTLLSVGRGLSRMEVMTAGLEVEIDGRIEGRLEELWRKHLKEARPGEDF